MTDAVIYYRLPGENLCVRLTANERDIKRLPSCESLNGQQGFVFAPFHPSAEEPIYLISSYTEESLNPESLADKGDVNIQGMESPHERADYAIDFANFHAQICSGEFSKLVLARRSHTKFNSHIDSLTLFANACLNYPRLFVALVSLPEAGTWLMATPEILLSGKHNAMRTIALAGTMKLDEKLVSLSVEKVWSAKNLMEQECVSSYLTECVEQFASDFTATGPYTTRAAGLMHLRTDFDFRLADSTRLGDVLATLHPTPAVCGMPKDKALQFILGNESFPRHYYSGFLGMLHPEADTQLFVSLRCLHLPTDKLVDFYAGGGLLADSVEENEWQETEAKMQTMKALFNHQKISTHV